MWLPIEGKPREDLYALERVGAVIVKGQSLPIGNRYWVWRVRIYTRACLKAIGYDSGESHSVVIGNGLRRGLSDAHSGAPLHHGLFCNPGGSSLGHAFLGVLQCVGAHGHGFV